MKKYLISFFTFFGVLSLAYGNKDLDAALVSFRKQNYTAATRQLYRIVFISRSNETEKMKARYYLGLSMMKLKLYQVATFPLIVAAKDAAPKMAQRAFENLVVISENLNDTGLLDYTLKKLDASDLSEIGQELYYNRMAQTLMHEEKYGEAVIYLQQALKVRSDSEEALYTLALVYLKQNKTAEALPLLEKVYEKYFSRPATDLKRGTAAMALGRAHYQAKHWNEAVSVYREIPKDHPLYREAQMELAWALFRSTKFRSAMSTIQTLHTPFYENFYDPESLILRSIILIFVCQYEEADKALTTFQKNYASAFVALKNINNSEQKPEFYYSQIEASEKYLKALKNERSASYKGQIPFFIVRSLMETPPLKNKMSYLDKIQQEKKRVAKLFNQSPDAAFRKYALKILSGRETNLSKELGRALKNALSFKEQELSLLAGDIELLHYEVLNGKKKVARQEYIKNLNKPVIAINENVTRDFYVKSGYRYWPFEGEYWRDEIGNYQYLGVNRCD